MEKEKLQGHLMAMCCAFFWGTAYIGSKNLVGDFAPVQVILCRQGLALLVLALITRQYLPLGGWAGLKRDRWLIIAGIFGAALYYLLEAMALQHTFATNVSLMVATSPLFSAVFDRFLPPEDRTGLSRSFFLGLALCLVGVALIILNGTRLHLSPLGDAIGLLASFSWAAYSFFLKKAQRVNEAQNEPLNDLLFTRRNLFYGWLFVLLVFLCVGAPFQTAIVQPKPLLILLYLGAFPSACAYLLWGRAINRIGMLSASLYIDLSPLIATASAALLLDEHLSGLAVLGMVTLLLGLAITQNIFGKLLHRKAAC